MMDYTKELRSKSREMVCRLPPGERKERFLAHLNAWDDWAIALDRLSGITRSGLLTIFLLPWIIYKEIQIHKKYKCMKQASKALDETYKDLLR